MALLTEKQLGVSTPVWEIQTASANQIDACCGFGRGINLLDNWYFIGGGSQQGGGQFPINQRVETEYTTGGYTIDRWSIDNKNTTNFGLRVTNEGVKLFAYGTGGQIFFSQQLESFPKYADKKLTISFLFSDNLLSTTVNIPPGIPTKNTQFARKVFNNFIIEVWYIVQNKALLLQTNTQNSTELILKAAKLELGPVQTLAHQDADGNWVLNDPPPNFQQELAKCQRYQYTFGSPLAYTNDTLLGVASSKTTAQFVIHFPVEMRCKPTMSVSENNWVWRFISSRGIKWLNSIGGVLRTTQLSTQNCKVLGESSQEIFTPGEAILLQTNEDSNAGSALKKYWGYLRFDANL